MTALPPANHPERDEVGEIIGALHRAVADHTAPLPSCSLLDEVAVNAADALERLSRENAEARALLKAAVNTIDRTADAILRGNRDIVDLKEKCAVGLQLEAYPLRTFLAPRRPHDPPRL